MLFVVFLMIFFIKHKNWALSSEMTSGWLLGPYGMGLKPSSDACKANDLLTVLLFQSLKGIVNAIGSLKKICWRLHPWLLSWWLYLETGSYFADVIKVLGVILHSKWQRAEETKKNADRWMQGKHNMKKEAEMGMIQSKARASWTISQHQKLGSSQERM